MDKKNQHYVPQFYLRRFAIEPQEPKRKMSNRAQRIFVFDKDNFQSESYSQHIKKVASSQDFYNFPTGINKRSTSNLKAFEDLLGVIEDAAATHLKDLENKVTNHKQNQCQVINALQKEDLSEFLVTTEYKNFKNEKNYFGKYV